jgi:Ca2+-transporting ATPase
MEEEVMEKVEEIYTGLTSQEAAERLRQYGLNTIEPQKKSSLSKAVISFLSEPVFLLLIGASLIYFILGEPRDGVVMLVFVTFMAGINLYQEWKTDKTLEALRNLSSPKVRVIRDGKETVVASDDLVPGDIMLLAEGERIPADGEILFADGFGVDESALTGEPDIVWKTAAHEPDDGSYWKQNHCYTGTNVIAGRAVVRVTATGQASEYGKIGKDIAEAPDRPTPLEKQTRKLVRSCSVFSFAMMLLVICATLWNGSGLADAVMSGITLAMATIPEEFPVVLTVFLAMGAWRIAQRNALIRRIQSVETLGAVTVLCVDKTGTLTQNKMTLRELVPFRDNSVNDLLKAAVMASETNPYDPMEAALIKAAEERGLDVSSLQGHSLAYEYPFSSEARMMGHVWAIDGHFVLAAKGSPENIFRLCELAESDIKEITAEQERLSNRGCRVLAIAMSRFEGNIPEKLTECRLRLIGLAGFMDPPREAVPAAINACGRAGIKVAMITGDNSTTAHRIAHEVGLEAAGENEHVIITGDELETFDEESLVQKLKRVTIFSRILPRQKMRIVKAFKAAGEVVAMTGDGVNDAPALKYADIGIAMGKRGTQVAREAADMVLLNDDFTTIVDTIRDGRRIYDNIRKAMEYIIVIHVPIALSALAAPLLVFSTLLLPIHVVLLELIIDPTCSIVFERQPAEPNIMDRPPRPANSSIVTKDVFIKAISQGLAIFAASFGSYLYTLPTEGAEHARTFFLTVLVLANLFLVYVNQSETKHAFTQKGCMDPVPWMINITILSGLILLSSVPALADAAKLKQLSCGDFAYATAIAAAATFWWEFVKFFKRTPGINGN